MYPEFDVTTHVVEPFEVPSHWQRYRGVDYNYAAPAACVWIAVDEKMGFWGYREYYRPFRTPEQVASDIRVMEGPDERVVMRMADPTLFAETGRPRIADLYAQGGVHLLEGSRDKAAGFAHVREALRLVDGQPRFRVFSNCTNLISEFKGYMRKRSLRPEATNPSEEAQKKNDHAMDALRYFFTMWYSASDKAPDDDDEPPDNRKKGSAAARLASLLPQETEEYGWST
jgi:hypothetical protein